MLLEICNYLLAAGQLTNSQARKVLELILSAHEFRQDRQPDYFGDFIKHLGKYFSFGGFNLKAGGMGLLLEILIVLAGLAALIYLVRRTAPFWNIIAPDVKSRNESPRAHIRQTPSDLMDEAERRASQGEYRHALRYTYLSLLLEMNSRRIISCGAAKTNSDYLQGISQKAAGLAQAFQSMVDLFERKWYGLEACSREDFQKGRELYWALLKEAPHG